jgi:hypothetical protein
MDTGQIGFHLRADQARAGEKEEKAKEKTSHTLYSPKIIRPASK